MKPIYFVNRTIIGLGVNTKNDILRLFTDNYDDPNMAS